MNRLTLNQLRKFFNLHQWVIRWYNLDATRLVHAQYPQGCHITGVNPLDKSEV
jgi:hypothetical protein